jgi:protocatechuate 3,4-dioxygenase beta subunit
MNRRALVAVTAMIASATIGGSGIFGQTRDVRPTSGTSILGGVVVSDTADAIPIRRALVTARPSDTGLTHQTTTDDAGRFLLTGLPPGTFTITVSRAGWVATTYGAKRPAGPGLSIALGDGERQAGLRIPLLPGAVVSGRVADERGRPMAGQLPVLLRLSTFGAERVLVPASGFHLPAASMATDDRGEFRLYGLSPGTYYVAIRPISTAAGATVTTAAAWRWALQTPASAASMASPPPQTLVGSVPVYFPGTIDPAAATPITVGPGEERADVSLTLRLVPVVRVSGVVTLSSGAPAARASVTIVPDQPIVSSLDQRMSVSADTEGRFAFTSVRPGPYRLFARAQSGGVRAAGGAAGGMTVLAWDQFAHQPINVTDSLGNLSIPLGPSSTVRGRLVFERSTLEPPADLRSVRIQMVEMTHKVLTVAATGSGGADIQMAMGSPEADGTFTLAGVVPARYLVMSLGQVTTAGGWTLKSVTVGGRNVLDDGLEVRSQQDVNDVVLTFTDKQTSLAGRLLDALGRPATAHFVFLFPADRRFWTPLSQRNVSPARPSSDGRYALRNLRPGDYYLVALSEYDDDQLTDPAYLEQLVPAAMRIALSEGEARTQDFKIAGR